MMFKLRITGCEQPRIWRFIELGIVGKTNRVGSDFLAGRLCCYAGHDRRIEAAAKEGGNRNVGCREPLLHRKREATTQFRFGIFESRSDFLGFPIVHVRQMVITTLAQIPVVEIKLKPMTRTKLLHCLERRVRRRQVGKAEEQRQACLVDIKTFVRQNLNRRDFGGKQQPFAVLKIYHRLFAVTVAGKGQPACTPIPDRKGEHSLQRGQTVKAIKRERRKQDFSVRVGPENAPPTFEVRAQFAVVIDFSVEDDSERPGMHGLGRSRIEVDDAQSSVTKKYPGFEMFALRVRAAVRKRCEGGGAERRRQRAQISPYASRQSTH